MHLLLVNASKFVPTSQKIRSLRETLRNIHVTLHTTFAKKELWNDNVRPALSH